MSEQTIAEELLNLRQALTEEHDARIQAESELQICKYDTEVLLKRSKELRDAVLVEQGLVTIYKAELRAVEVKLEQAMVERDAAEEAASHFHYLVTGASPEWSNLFGYAEAGEQITDCLNLLKTTVKNQMAELRAVKEERDELEVRLEAIEDLAQGLLSTKRLTDCLEEAVLGILAEADITPATPAEKEESHG